MRDREPPEERGEIEIRYLGLARLVAGVDEDSAPWPSEGTVGELLKMLCERYGRDFQTSIFTMNRTLQNYVKIEVDEVDIDALQGLETSLQPFARGQVYLDGRLSRGRLKKGKGSLRESPTVSIPVLRARFRRERLGRLLCALIRGYRFMNQRYRETVEIIRNAGYELDKDMDASLWEGKYHMFERIPQDGMVNEAGLELVIEEEKAGCE